MKKSAKGKEVKKATKSPPAVKKVKPGKGAPPAPAREKTGNVPVKPVPATQEDAAGENRILRELGALRTLLERPAAARLENDAMLESFVDSLRRLLCELIETRQDGVVSRIAGIRAMAATIRSDRRVLESLDGLMTELGAISFEAQKLDYVDPFIHRVVAESADESAPDGVVLETIQPGFRTGRGAVVAKAEVVVNRRG